MINTKVKSRTTHKCLKNLSLLQKQLNEAFKILNLSAEEISEESIVQRLKSNTKQDVAAMHLLVVEKYWQKFNCKDLKAFIQKHYDCHYTTALRKYQHYEITYSLRLKPTDYVNFTPNSLSKLLHLKPAARKRIVSELTDNFSETKFSNVTSSTVKQKAIELGFLDVPEKKSEQEKLTSQFTELFINNGKPSKLVKFLKDNLTEKHFMKLVTSLQREIAKANSK